MSRRPLPDVSDMTRDEYLVARVIAAIERAYLTDRDRPADGKYFAADFVAAYDIAHARRAVA